MEMFPACAELACSELTDSPSPCGNWMWLQPGHVTPRSQLFLCGSDRWSGKGMGTFKLVWRELAKPGGVQIWLLSLGAIEGF